MEDELLIPIPGIENGFFSIHPKYLEDFKSLSDPKRLKDYYLNVPVKVVLKKKATTPLIDFISSLDLLDSLKTECYQELMQLIDNDLKFKASTEQLLRAAIKLSDYLDTQNNDLSMELLVRRNNLKEALGLFNG